jgi:hypothetical protein
LAANAWFQLSWISNELGSPKVLACPADKVKKARMADNWGAGPGGFLNTAQRDNAVSYWVGADAGQIYGTGGTRFASLEKASSHGLLGDRNIATTGRSGCSLPLNDIWAVATRPYTAAGWTNNIHEKRGNIALGDGSVSQTGYSQMTNIMAQADDNGSVHLIMP